MSPHCCCRYCKRKRYHRKVELYKKAAAAGVPASLKEPSLNSKSSDKRRKAETNGVIPTGNGVMVSGLQNGEIWQSSLPVLNSKPSPYYVYAAPNYMTTLPSENTSKYVVMNPNGQPQQKYASKTLPRKPAKLTAENLMKYQQQNGGMFIEKPAPMDIYMNGKVRMNGHATLPNLSANRRNAQMNGQVRMTNGHAQMNDHVPSVRVMGGNSDQQPFQYLPNMADTEVTPAIPDPTNASLYPIKYVDNSGQTYMFVDPPKTSDTDNHLIAGTAVAKATTGNGNGSHNSSGRNSVEHKVVTRSAETKGTTSIQQKSPTTMADNKLIATVPPKSTVAVSGKQEAMVKPRPKATAIATSKPAREGTPPEKKITDLVDFTLVKEDDREMKEVAVFMRWSPQLQKREITNDGSLQYVATMQSRPNGSAGDYIPTNPSPHQMTSNQMPTIVVTSDDGVIVPRNNLR